MDSKGSHIGVIASFSIFILFLVAMVFIVDPFVQSGQDKGFLADLAASELIKEFELNLTTVLINATDSTKGVFLNLNQQFGFESGNLPDVIVKDKDGQIKNLEVLSVGPDILEIETNSIGIFWIFFANVNFSDTPPSGSATYSLPEIKSIRVKEEIFEERVANVSRDFELFKQSVNFPEGSDFGFDFVLSNGTVIGTDMGENILSGDVFVKEFPVTYIDNYANKLVGELRVKVW